MRWSVGRQVSRRGAGLGNEVFPWAKATIGAELYGLSPVEPSWKTSPYDYRPALGGSVASTARHFSLSYAVPALNYTSEDYLASAVVDYRESLVARFGTQLSEPARLVLRHSSGMHGGYLGILSARPALRDRLPGGAEPLGWEATATATATATSVATQAQGAAEARGIPLGALDDWPQEFIDAVEFRRATSSLSPDLIYYGVVPA